MKLSQEVQKKIRRICKFHPIRIMVLFGSAASNAPRDVDLAVFPQIGVPAEEVDKLALIGQLEPLFRKAVDLVVVDGGTSTTLLYEICRKAVVLCEAEPASFEEERSLAFRKYADTVKFRKLREQVIRNFAQG